MYSRLLTSQKLPTTGCTRSILPLVPIGAVTLFIIIANVIFIIFRLFLPYPNSPWEAGIIADAWRMLHGQAVYAVGADHATTMYGPLLTVLLAQVFRFTGLASVLQVSRLVSIICGIAVVTMLARVFGRDRLAFGVAAALLLAANTRTAYYFTEIRPDLDCLFFATLSLPLFALAFVHWLLTDAIDTWQLPRFRWLIAALVCTIPPCIVFEAKEGGAANSLIPAFLSVRAFCAWRAPVAFALLRDAARPLPLRIITGVTLGIMLFAQVYSPPGSLSQAGLKGGYGAKERALVIAEARSLPGKVVSPDDPSIALIAKGYAGRTAVFEADAVDWDFGRMQGPFVKELDSADYVIVMPGMGIVEHDKHLLPASGFTKSAFRTTSTPVYELWHRTQPPGPPSSLTR